MNVVIGRPLNEPLVYSPMDKTTDVEIEYYPFTVGCPMVKIDTPLPPKFIIRRSQPRHNKVQFSAEIPQRRFIKTPSLRMHPDEALAGKMEQIGSIHPMIE